MSDSPIYSDFWLEKERYSDYIDPNTENTDEVFAVDLIKLASVRRIVSNYVDILTGESIPVYFKAVGDSFNVGGKEIYITTAIHRKKDFDKAVGLALHEAAHTLKTNFDLVKTIWSNVPKPIWDFCDKNNIRRLTMERFIKSIFNIIEDWYIDDWVISRMPGYIGYYEASYNDIYNSPVVDQLMIGNEYKYPSLASYEFRIINFTNPLTDLSALSGLEEIARLVDITNISRLKKTRDRIKISYEVIYLVLKNIELAQKMLDDGGQTNTPKKGNRIDVDSFFKSEKDDKTPSKSDSEKTIEEVADKLGNRPTKEDKENESMTTRVSNSADKELPKEVKKAIEKQFQYVHGNVEKKELNPQQKTMLDLIEKHGITLVYVPVSIDDGNDQVFKVGCIVVKKFTKELIEAGAEMCPLIYRYKDENGDIQPRKETAEAVSKGILLGNKLGRKLMIRREENCDKTIRKKHGKINRRLLFSAGHDADDLFEIIKISRYNKGTLHITVDASTSMTGKKWDETMTMCVAICKATSMVDNIHVTVSFRATKNAKGVEMPYIMLAYDSNKDKISKIKSLFKYLHPCGATPEGLAFGAIMDLFTNITPDEEDRYFLNISDGEPYFRVTSPVTGTSLIYADGNGVEHTRSQVNKIRKQGVNVLSYYVQDEDNQFSSWLGDGHNTKQNFQSMYGKDAKYIKTDSVVDLANTINELFLNR